MRGKRTNSVEPFVRGKLPARELAFVFVMLVSGCNIVGPPAIRQGHILYNEAISHTRNEQLLLNLVRLRYRDIPLFLKVTSVSTQYSFRSAAGVNQRVNWNNAGGDIFGVDLGVEYSERPTVTYSPLQGEKFAQQLMTPMPLESILMLAQSGWDLDRVLRCCVQRINEVGNATGAAGPTPAGAPQYEAFIKITRVLHRLQVEDRLRLGVQRKSEDELEVTLEIKDEGRVEELQTTELKKLLGLNPQVNRFRFASDVLTRTDEEIVVVPRSLLAVMFYLCQAVEPPEQDEADGRVTVTLDGEGKPFNWNRVHGKLFRVPSQTARPENAAVKVFYRGSWFYLSDDDLDSKSTFALLSFLFSSQAGDVRSLGPLLTLPVGT